MNLPYCRRPCRDCPFKKDTLRGWLGESRMTEILAQPSFTCHKTDRTLQCAGHMILKGNENAFVALAGAMEIEIKLSGHDEVFASEADAIEHHK